jgi:tyrosine decarboxylase/aspartate 1-decarboxylase
VVPESAHFSFTKICDLLKIKPKKAKLNTKYQVDPVFVKAANHRPHHRRCGERRFSKLGTVDPIEELSEIALNHGVPLHVDAAFGGLVLPFLKRTGLHGSSI